jgi:hypothetical protein
VRSRQPALTVFLLLAAPVPAVANCTRDLHAPDLRPEPGYLRLAPRFARRGYLLELQVRYHPDRRQEGDLRAWRRHVREVMRRFGRIRRLVALQVTNEVNLTLSRDSSDGSYERAREALVEGVVAAKEEAQGAGFRRLEIGFNWFWRLDPETERTFWRSLRELGGHRSARSVDLARGWMFTPAPSFRLHSRPAASETRS